MGTLHPALHRAREALSSPFFRQHGYTERPLLLQWMPSTDCPLSCGHCLLRGSQPRLAPMAWPLQLALLDEVAELELPELLLSGGEPLALPQFNAIVGAIAERKLRWSLNTALRPSREQRERMRQHPPSFVALSLDGDAGFHDAFRGREGAFAEVLEAVRDFRALGAQVAIGTTVHARNFSQLDALFGVVLASQADSWGLHLCVPEGAGADPSLRLSRRQLSALLDFVALKRRAFPVGLADELGFCGDWEPMLRDAPFFCAAGRAQCVVLPDGSLLPCTSLDLRHSAGRFGEQSLMQLWSAGFAALREHRPSLRCQSCRYAPACGGGCWLQRKHGEECFKDVWMPRQFLGASASLALALGLSACTGMNPPPPPPPEVPAAEQKVEADLGAEPKAQHTAVSPERRSEERDTGAINPDLPLATASCVATEPFYDAERLEGLLVEWALVRSAWPAEGLPKPSSIIPRLSALDEDPARDDLLALFVDETMEGPAFELLDSDRELDLGQLEQRLQLAFQTRYRSMSYAALLWAELARYSICGPAPSERSAADSERLSALLSQLRAQSECWRAEIFRLQLDPFLSMSPEERRGQFMVKKSMIGSERERVHRQRVQLAMEHWGLSELEAELSEAMLSANPYAAGMSLKLELVSGEALEHEDGAGAELRSPATSFTFGIFDVLRSANEARLRLRSGELEYELELPADALLSWADLSRLVYEQHSLRAVQDSMSYPGGVAPILIATYQARYLSALESSPQDADELRHLRARLIELMLF